MLVKKETHNLLLAKILQGWLVNVTTVLVKMTKIIHVLVTFTSQPRNI